MAGELVEAVSGQSWEDFIRTRILDRLGMSHSDVHRPAAGTAGNVATPHAEVRTRSGPSRRS